MPNQLGRWPEEPFYLAVARGLIPGTSLIHVAGHNENVGTSYEILDSVGGTHVYPTAEITGLKISSTSTADTSAGTGARTVIIQGLSLEFVEISETVILNGQTGVSLVNDYFRFNAMLVDTAGSGSTNAGVIAVGTGVITAGVPAVEYDRIDADFGIMHSSIYTIPAGKEGYFIKPHLTPGKGQTVDALFRHRDFSKAFQVFEEIHVYQSPFTLPIEAHHFPEKTDVDILVKADTGNIEVSAGYHILLVDIDLVNV